MDVFGASDTAAPYATTYLRISSLGIPAMLVVMAATGVLRGLQDTRTPLYVAIGGFAANGALNAGLVYGAGLGIAGSAWGTVIAQVSMAVAYLIVVVRGRGVTAPRCAPTPQASGPAPRRAFRCWSVRCRSAPS